MRTIGGSVYTLTHDAENWLVSISGAATADFSYDADGNRVKSVLNGETVIYVGNLYEKKVVGSTTTHTKYYYFGGRRIAVRVAGTLSWLLGDHLGSTTVTADGATSVRTAELWYKPWGESRGTPFGATPTPRRFTGQVLDSVAGGLYFYNARYYDPVLGRFAQADTIVPEPGDPQALNRYSYVLNNPLRFIDDTGEIAIDIVGGGGGGGAGMAGVMLASGLAQTLGQQISALTVRLASAANATMQTWSLAGNQVIAAGDRLDQAMQGAGQAGNTADPGGLDPKKLDPEKVRATVKGGEVLRRWGPHDGPGPLPEKIASTFRSASYSEVKLTKDITLYRSYGGKVGEIGGFWTRTQPRGPMQAQLDEAILPEWGNSVTQVARIRVPAGTIIYEGYAGEQMGPLIKLLGGGNQVYVPYVDPSWLMK